MLQSLLVQNDYDWKLNYDWPCLDNCFLMIFNEESIK